MYFSSFDLEVTQESSFSDLLNDLNYKDRHLLLLLMTSSPQYLLVQVPKVCITFTFSCAVNMS